jgi:DNA-binding transcriptional regulator YdaS (Cro superfamily)
MANRIEVNIKLINQHEVARILGYDPSYINKILKGVKKGPAADRIISQINDIYSKITVKKVA